MACKSETSFRESSFFWGVNGVMSSVQAAPRGGKKEKKRKFSKNYMQHVRGAQILKWVFRAFERSEPHQSFSSSLISERAPYPLLMRVWCGPYILLTYVHLVKTLLSYGSCSASSSPVQRFDLSLLQLFALFFFLALLFYFFAAWTLEMMSCRFSIYRGFVNNKYHPPPYSCLLK